MKYKKNIIIIGIVLLGIFICLWMIPIKPTTINIKQTEEKGKVTLLCEIDQITGPLWRIKKNYSNKDITVTHIDIAGNTPNKYLKNSIICYRTDFLFRGNFDQSNPELFIVDEWDFVGAIFRDYNMCPFYPPYGVNIFEINIHNK